MKEKWGKLTDDDINVINGRRDQLEGKLQERYGLGEGSGPQGCRRLVQGFALTFGDLPVIRKTPGGFCAGFFMQVRSDLLRKSEIGN